MFNSIALSKKMITKLKGFVFNTLLLTTLLFTSLQATADQFKQFANLEVHYIALPSTLLSQVLPLNIISNVVRIMDY